MNKIFLLVFLLILPACSSIRPSFVRENSYAVAPVDSGGENLGGHFDDNDNWVPDNPDIPLTYKIPDISAGFLFDANSLDITPCLQIELLEIDSHIPYLRTIKFDAGVGYQRAYLYVGKLWTSIFEISTGGFCGWNFEDKELSFGIAATIIRF